MDQVLGWLPADTETLIVANGPIRIRDGELRDDLPFLETAQSFSYGLLAQIKNGLLQKGLHGQEIKLAVEGSRRFTSPAGLGMMPYEGCQIVFFEESAHVALKSAVERCFEQASEVVEIGEAKAAVFAEHWEDDDWTLLVASPRPDMLLCATDRGYLEQLLSRMHGERTERAFPVALKEWRHVDLEAPVWAIRHYREESAEADPSSPLRAQAAANVPDPDAIGFTFSFDAKSKQRAVAHYLSTSKDAVKIAAEGWVHPTERLNPNIKQIQPGVIEISAPLGDIKNGGDGSSMFLFVLLAYLGHAVYL